MNIPSRYDWDVKYLDMAVAYVASGEDHVWKNKYTGEEIDMLYVANKGEEALSRGMPCMVVCQRISDKTMWVRTIENFVELYSYGE